MVSDLHLAVDDHLVCDGAEKTSHALSRVVVASDGVDHFDGIHQSRQSLLDALWVADIEGLEVFLKSLQILDIVLSLGQALSDLVVKASPVGSGHVDLLVVDAKLVLELVASGVKKVIDSSAGLAAELLANLSELTHALLPVV
jgi:hypothetical protein